MISLRSQYNNNDNENNTEIIVRLERHNNKLKQVIESIKNGLEDVSDKYKELFKKTLEQKETFNSKLMTVFNEFSDERDNILYKLKIA